MRWTEDGGVWRRCVEVAVKVARIIKLRRRLRCHHLSIHFPPPLTVDMYGWAAPIIEHYASCNTRVPISQHACLQLSSSVALGAWQRGTHCVLAGMGHVCSSQSAFGARNEEKEK